MCYLGLHKKKREDSRVLAIESLASGKEDREIQRRKTEKTKEKIQARAHREREGQRIWRTLFKWVCCVRCFNRKSDEETVERGHSKREKKMFRVFSFFFCLALSPRKKATRSAVTQTVFLVFCFEDNLFIFSLPFYTRFWASRTTDKRERETTSSPLFCSSLIVCVGCFLVARSVCVCVLLFFFFFQREECEKREISC